MTIRDVFTFAWLFEGPTSWRAGSASPGTSPSGEAGGGPLARGVDPYLVELLLEAEQPVRFCACPAARAGLLCKHVLATAPTLTEPSAEALFAHRPPGPSRLARRPCGCPLPSRLNHRDLGA